MEIRSVPVHFALPVSGSYLMLRSSCRVEFRPETKAKIIRVIFSLLMCTVLISETQCQAAGDCATTAWHNGAFHVEKAGVIGRSDIVLARPNLRTGQAMPLGNGHLGAAIWSAEGFTAQLNRADTLPDRLSPGQVVIPGIATLTNANDYSGRLDLHNGEFREHGAGMTAVAYVRSDRDVLVIDVKGANPGVFQSALLRLWEPRFAQAGAIGRMAFLDNSWVDDKTPGASYRPFGALSAITAHGRDVAAVVTGPLTVQVTFRPYEDGHFSILVASPHYDGTQDARQLIASLFSGTKKDAHREWWHAFWNRAATIKIATKDGTGEYMENLRNIYLFIAAAEKGDEFPGSQAGVADMVSSAQDAHRWDPSAYWHWNLRMQVGANIGAGLANLNAPYFNLYRENLANIEAWTKGHMAGSEGSCVPETMRFNGQGMQHYRDSKAIEGLDCDASFKPFFNARTLTTGAEVSLWVWRQYLATNDHKFLVDNYPVIASSARFVLAYADEGPDGFLHTNPSNAHETQWDVRDPTTDIAAMMALFPVAIHAARLLNKDPDLVLRLEEAIHKIPPFPRTQSKGLHTLQLSMPGMDRTDVIAESYDPGKVNHNVENIGLEPVWPYDLIGDRSLEFALARRTFASRTAVAVADWSFDPIQAARLGLKNEVASSLIRITEQYQNAVNGLANWDVEYGEFYVEQAGVVATALQEALVQDYDGLIRIAPAIPPAWDVDGSVFVKDNRRIDVQVRNGVVTTVVIGGGDPGTINVRNPWEGQLVDVVSANTGLKVASSAINNVITFQGAAGVSYLLERHEEVLKDRRFEAISGVPAYSAKKLQHAQVGLF